jgi:hypothetical protein
MPPLLGSGTASVTGVGGGTEGAWSLDKEKEMAPSISDRSSPPRATMVPSSSLPPPHAVQMMMLQGLLVRERAAMDREMRLTRRVLSGPTPGLEAP